MYCFILIDLNYNKHNLCFDYCDLLNIKINCSEIKIINSDINNVNIKSKVCKIHKKNKNKFNKLKINTNELYFCFNDFITLKELINNNNNIIIENVNTIYLYSKLMKLEQINVLNDIQKTFPLAKINLCKNNFFN